MMNFKQWSGLSIRKKTNKKSRHHACFFYFVYKRKTPVIIGEQNGGIQMKQKFKRRINTATQRTYLVCSLLFMLFFSLDRSFPELMIALLFLILFYIKSSSITFKEDRFEINIYEFRYERIEKIEIKQKRKRVMLVITFKERMPLSKTYKLDVKPLEEDLDAFLAHLEETHGIPCQK